MKNQNPTAAPKKARRTSETVEIHKKWARTLSSYQNAPKVIAASLASVDEFFAHHPAIERNEINAGFIAGLAIERTVTSMASTDIQPI
jgi:thiaminase